MLRMRCQTGVINAFHAGLLAYLLSEDAAFFCGSVITMDGGTEAALRADDWPAARP